MQTNRSSTGALVGGAVLIALGLLSLAGQVFRDLNWGFLWPFTVIVFGGLFFVAMFAGGRGAAGFAIPGSIIGGIGLVLLIQNIFHHWESMSYFWTLIIMFIGIGIYIMGWYGEDANQRHSGKRVMRTGLILFIIFGTFFEMIFSSFSSLTFPILLMVLGIYFVITRSGLFNRKTSDSMPTQIGNSDFDMKPTNPVEENSQKEG